MTPELRERCRKVRWAKFLQTDPRGMLVYDNLTKSIPGWGNTPWDIAKQIDEIYTYQSNHHHNEAHSILDTKKVALRTANMFSQFYIFTKIICLNFAVTLEEITHYKK
jgi:hypothetical protein